MAQMEMGFGVEEQQGSEVLGTGPPHIRDPPPNSCLCLPGCAGLQGRAGGAPWGWAHGKRHPLALSSLNLPTPYPAAGMLTGQSPIAPVVRVERSSPVSLPGARGREERDTREVDARLRGLVDPHPHPRAFTGC